MNRKFSILLSLVLVTAFALAACGTPPTEAPAAATEAPVEPAAPASPAEPEKVTITWWHISTKDPALSDWQKMADDYMAAHPNVTIEIVDMSGEGSWDEKLTAMAARGGLPDVFMADKMTLYITNG